MHTVTDCVYNIIRAKQIGTHTESITKGCTLLEQYCTRYSLARWHICCVHSSYAALKLCAVLGCVLMLLAYTVLIHISHDGVQGHGVVVGVQQLYIHDFTRALNLEAAVGGP